MAGGLSSMAGLSGHQAVDDACMQQVRILSSFCEDDMTPALKQRVYHAMLGAFSQVCADRRPTNAEVLTMLGVLWQQGPDAGKQGDSLKQLVALTTAIELLLAELRQVDGALEERGAEGEGNELGDAGTPSMAPVSAALRDARARVLVYARDGYMYDPRRADWRLGRPFCSDSSREGARYCRYAYRQVACTCCIATLCLGIAHSRSQPKNITPAIMLAINIINYYPSARELIN